MKVPEIPSLQIALGRIRELQSQIYHLEMSASSPKVFLKPKSEPETKSSPTLSVEPQENPNSKFEDYLKGNHPNPSLAQNPIYKKILEESNKKGLDPNLVGALIKVESNFQPQAKSPKGALGLMQLMPSTARMLGVTDPTDPIENLEAGTTYLKDLMDMFGDRRLALAAYNAGPNAVKSYGGIPPYRETMQYVSKIEKLLENPNLIFDNKSSP